MAVHNQVASVANLARAQLLALDRAAINTSIQTQTLVLLLTTLIDLATPTQDQSIADSAHRTVLGHGVAISEAMKARDG
jgi:hypothetical protein